MKTKILAFLLTCVFTGAIHAQKEYKHSSTYEIGESGAVYVSCEDAEVWITGTDTDVVSVKVDRKVSGSLADRPFSIDYRTHNGDFYLEEKKERTPGISWKGGTIHNYTITLEVPNGAGLNVKGDDDDYHISNINGYINLRSEDGTLNLSHCTASSIKLQMEDGDMILEDMNGNLDVMLEDGDFICKNSEFGVISAMTEDGDFILKNTTVKMARMIVEDGNISLDEVHGDLDLKADDGDISVKDMRGEKCSIVTVDGDVFLNLHAQPNGDYRIKSEDGDVAAHFSGEGLEIQLHCDDCDVAASESIFHYLKDKERNKLIQTNHTGTAAMTIETMDGDVMLKSKNY